MNDKIVSISDESIIWTVQSQLSPKGKSTSSTSITFELIHVLHVYGIALFNLSQTIADNVGNYDSDITLSENQRRTYDDNLANAVNLLNTSAGIFKYISEIAIDNFESARDVDSQILNREYNTGLSKLSLAISQSLAIRKLMSPLFAYTLQNPGPPLPKNHPSPQILLKLHIDTSSLFSVSRMLLKSSIKSTFKVQHVDLPTDLKLFTKRCENFHSSIAKKWLGVDAASNGQTGFAIAWLRLSYDELSESSSSTSSERFKLLSKNTRKARDERKSLLEVELSSIDTYLKAYKQLNDTVSIVCVNQFTFLYIIHRFTSNVYHRHLLYCLKYLMADHLLILFPSHYQNQHGH